MAERGVTVWICPRGHKDLTTLHGPNGKGQCWQCHPGGRLRGEGPERGPYEMEPHPFIPEDSDQPRLREAVRAYLADIDGPEGVANDDGLRAALEAPAEESSDTGGLSGATESDSGTRAIAPGHEVADASDTGVSGPAESDPSPEDSVTGGVERLVDELDELFGILNVPGESDSHVRHKVKRRIRRLAESLRESQGVTDRGCPTCGTVHSPGPCPDSA